MYENRETIDLTTVFHKADSEFLKSSVISRTPQFSIVSAMEYASIIKSTYVKRCAYFSAVEILIKSTSPISSPEEVLQIPQKFSDGMNGTLQRKETKSISSVINDIAEDLQSGEVLQVPTSFRGIDYITNGGFNGGELIVLAARPSVGKTAVMLQMARNASTSIPSLCLSLEMNGKQLGKRLISSTNYIDPINIRKGNVDWEGFERAAKEFDGKNLYIDDNAFSIDEVCTSITLNHQQGKCKIAFVDYLGLIEDESDKTDNISNLLAVKTRRLKRLAMRLEIPIVLLCQLNRNSDREKRAPEMHDLRDSGAIEQDADIVLMLEKARDSDNEPIDGRVTMWVRKNRSGQGGNLKLDLKVDNNYTNFTEL